MEGNRPLLIVGQPKIELFACVCVCISEYKCGSQTNTRHSSFTLSVMCCCIACTMARRGENVYSSSAWFWCMHLYAWWVYVGSHMCRKSLCVCVCDVSALALSAAATVVASSFLFTWACRCRAIVRDYMLAATHKLTAYIHTFCSCSPFGGSSSTIVTNCLPATCTPHFIVLYINRILFRFTVKYHLEIVQRQTSDSRLRCAYGETYQQDIIVIRISCLQLN